MLGSIIIRLQSHVGEIWRKILIVVVVELWIEATGVDGTGDSFLRHGADGGLEGEDQHLFDVFVGAVAAGDGEGDFRLRFVLENGRWLARLLLVVKKRWW